MTAPANILLAPLSALYGAAMRTRLMLYRTGTLAALRVDAPVISVGNITTGGTGKTPHVAWLARRLAARGHSVCILTRGYGRENPSQQVIVSDGERLRAEAREGGDEPRLLAEMLAGRAAVISNADRAAAARWARENLQSDVFILDDGFQHLAIARDLNLLLIDATNPWGGGHLLPRGRLREPLRGLKRADAIIITRANLAADIHKLRTEIEHLSEGRPVLLSETRTARVVQLDESLAADEKDAVPNSLTESIAAFCALGNPEAFFAHLRSDGHRLAHTKSFPDHHTYTQGEIDALTIEAKRDGAQSLLTTAKDAVKLRGLRFELPCYVVEIDVSFDDEAQMEGMLKKLF